MVTRVMTRKATAPRPVRHRSNGLRTRAEIVAAAERHFAERGERLQGLNELRAQR